MTVRENGLEIMTLRNYKKREEGGGIWILA
jgi:hypothetical protein